MITAQDVAKYVIKFFHESEDLITNLKLQKLLYYIQGWHLGLYEKPLFEEDFQAWVHGPVQPAIYGEYKSYRWNPISEDIPDIQFPDAVKTHIDEVLETFGPETAYSLERMTHHEEPWILARNGIPHEQDCTNVITKQSMQSYFSRRANEEN
jgi:uncharacterized phage-associated protein